MTNTNYSFKERLRYRFDNTMSKGPVALIAWLGILSALVILIATVVLIIFHVHKGEDADAIDFIEATWQSLLHTLDSGTIGGAEGWFFRLVMLFVTIGGIFVVSTFIGIINNAINDKLEELRKGRSQVLEKNHTLILGWSNKIFTIVNELITANENQKKPCIVIMADKDKVEMEDAIRERFPDSKNTKIICRSGNPIDLNDLHMVNPYQSKSIIILAPEIENPDIHVIKTILAITNSPTRRAEPYHIVAEIRDAENVDIVKLAGNKEVTFVLYKDFISRLVVQTCRQSGLSVVYTELLDFGGDEIYFSEIPQLVGKTYAESLHYFEKSCVMGIRFANGDIKVNPPMETIINSGDKIIAISEDDGTIVFNPKTNFEINDNAISKVSKPSKETDSTLILGWNTEGITVVKEMDNYANKDSLVTIVSEFPIEDNEITDYKFNNIKLNIKIASTTDRKVLDELNIPSFQHIIVLSYSDILEAQEADARTLITLLNLRDIANKHGKQFNIVSEMMDIKNKELASVINADDFIVSHHLISLLLSQLSENKELKTIFDDLFDADGSEIYLKPAENYVEMGVPVNFHTILKAASLKGETAIGYRKNCYSTQEDKAYGIVVNPKKSEMVTFEKIDKIIVLAEE